MASKHGWSTTSSSSLAATGCSTSSASTAPTSRTSTTRRTSVTASRRYWPSTSSRRPPWPTDTAAPPPTLGVVAATSGGGSLNLVAGLGESFTSRVPVLALVGQPPTALDGRGSFQDTSGRQRFARTPRRCSPRCRCTAGGCCHAADIADRAARRHRRRAHRRARGVAAAQGHSAGPIDRTSTRPIGAAAALEPSGRPAPDR